MNEQKAVAKGEGFSIRELQHCDMIRCALLSVFFVSFVDAHGSLVIPQTRNAIDRFAPQWKGGYPTVPDFPGTGRWGLPNETCATRPWSCQEGCTCSNGTESCDVGQSCFWFSSGCTIGCDVCDGDGRRDGTACRCGKCANATLNNPKWRTGNRAAVPGSDADWTKYNPWRSPGLAPTFDPCGMAGGGPTSGVESGEYNTTQFAKQGDVGSNLPEAKGTVWRAGALEQTGWYIRANHGGGYSFRLCPKGEPLTEACFQKTPLAFEGPQVSSLAPPRAVSRAPQLCGPLMICAASLSRRHCAEEYLVHPPSPPFVTR